MAFFSKNPVAHVAAWYAAQASLIMKDDKRMPILLGMILAVTGMFALVGAPVFIAVAALSLLVGELTAAALCLTTAAFAAGYFFSIKRTFFTK